MADWVTISALATAGGTLALAGATYASVRSSNRSARLAEVALQEQRRPVLMHSNDDDHPQPVSFGGGGHRMSLGGGQAALEVGEDGGFLAVSLRNVGAGIAVLQGWRAEHAGTVETASQGWRESIVKAEAPPVDEFKPLMRDQYIPSGGLGAWQAALRDTADPMFAVIADAVKERRVLSLDLLYSDQVGGQRTISRFGLLPDEDNWRAVVVRYWYLDADAPR